jgi:hypothetical protein
MPAETRQSKPKRGPANILRVQIPALRVSHRCEAHHIHSRGGSGKLSSGNCPISEWPERLPLVLSLRQQAGRNQGPE